MELYLAPLNLMGNHVYRHIILENGADFCFSELIVSDDYEMQRKTRVFPEDLDRTIFQIGVSSPGEIEKLAELLPKTRELNVNMGCPHSSMRKKAMCSGILFHPELMKEICNELSRVCARREIIASVKLRLGTNPKNIEIERYMQILLDSGIEKAYIHARTLRQSYHRPANYEPLIGLRKKFPGSRIIVNGDIDSYNRFRETAEKVECDGIMIGRAALHNPFIFRDIREKRLTTSGPYDPVLRDTGNENDGMIRPGMEKLRLIEKFLSLSEKEGLPLNIAKKNLGFLMKGWSNTTRLRDSVNRCRNYRETIEHFYSYAAMQADSYN